MTMRTFLVEDNHIILENLVSTLEELAPAEVIGMADSEEEGATCCRDAISGKSDVMNHTPSVPEPAPGTYIPTEMPPLDAPSGPDQPPEIDPPPPAEPTIPIREPGSHVPVRAASAEN